MQTQKQAQQIYPKEGEVWWIGLDPTLGHEQNGRRPVVVVSPSDFNRVAGRIIAIPCTTKAAPAGTFRAQLQVPISSLPQATFAMPDQVRVLNWHARTAVCRGEAATAAELEAIRERLKALQGII